MTATCGRTFEDALLTGYLDGAITQADEQRVRLHLEACGRCRSEVEEMRRLREVTMTTRFDLPADDQWSERPRGPASRLSFGLGWTVLALWLVGVTGFAIGQLWSGPETVVEKLLAFGGLSGLALLFLSVLLDRLRTLKTDRYRGVQR